MASGFHPALDVRNILIEDPGANCKKLKRMVSSKLSAKYNKQNLM